MSRPITAVRWTTAFVALLVALLALPRPGLAQTKTDVIRGRVIGQDTLPLANAQVAVVDSAASPITPHIVRTDAKGAFSISIEGGGRYMVAATMLGHAPQRRIVTRGADGTFAPLEFKLGTVAATLDAVRSVGERPKTARSEVAGDNSIGGTTTFVSPNNGLIGDFTGDLSAALATIPGITIIPSATGDLPTISAFGITGGNSTALNGMSFGGNVPRDGFRVAVVSSTYDPSKGGFAGIQTSVRMNAGSNLKFRSLHGTLDAPQLQWTTPVAQRLSTRYDQQIVSGTASGPIVLDHVFYSSSFQLQRRTSGLTSLSNADAATLAALRISSDSVQRLFTLLGPTGIPLRTSDVPSQRQNMEARGAVRFDWTPNTASGAGPTLIGPEFIVIGGGSGGAQDSYYLQAGGTVRNSDGLMIGTTSIPSFGGQSTHRDGWTQFTAAKYLPKSILNETTVSFSGAVDHTDPYLDLPSARILVGSTLADGEGGLTTLTVGGNSQPRTESRGWQTELRNQTSWNTWDKRHSLQLTVSGAQEGFVAIQDAGFGSYSYNSLSDFATGRPASYSRTLTGRRGSGSALTGALGIGDTYVTQAPKAPVPGGLGITIPPPMIQYGLRIEGNHFGSAPGYNRQVDSVFGLRTDHVPSTVAVMPMLGFRAQFLPPIKSDFGFFFGPRLTVNGGIREYRGSIAARTLDSYSRQTGLPDAIRQLYCVGDATPSANWQQFEASSGAIPTACADGTNGSLLAQSTPPIAAYAQNYALFESWRPTLDASFQVNQDLRIAVNGTYTLNRDMPSFYDVNLNPTSRFALASEGGRPVYVSASSIVTATGATAWTESRVSPLFAHVAESRSDLRGETHTLGGTLSYSPLILNSTTSWFGSVGYTYSDSREQYRGFTSTDGDPTQVGWSRGSQAKHAVTLNFRYANKLGSLSMFGRMQSGAAYTPSVIGDINGDGYSNDRAFVFNPAVVADTSIANGMTRLLASAPSGARACLARQIGTIVGRNSCTAPWAFTNLSLSISPDNYRIGLGNRGSVSFFVNNILSGLDQAVHGSNKLHGWGQSSFPDPTLLTVRGFDPMKQQFIYTVNPQFGNTAVFRNTFRQPFQLTVDFRMDVSPDRETQQLESLLRPRKADNVKMLSEAQIKSRIARANDPVQQLLLIKDSLKLTDAQVDSMKKLSQKAMVSRDSIAGVVAHYLFLRNGDYGGADVREYWHAAAIASYTVYFRSMKQILAVFTPEQIERSKHLPQTIGLVTQLSSITEADIPWQFRFAVGSLP